MWTKKEKKLFLTNVAIVLLASLLALYGLRGGILEKLDGFLYFSTSTIEFIFLTILFLLFSFVFALGALNVLNAKIIEVSDSKLKLSFLIVGWILYFLSLSLLVLKEWALGRFPMNQPIVVYFTLTKLTTEAFDKSIFIESGKILFICFLISAFFFFASFIINHKFKVSHFSTKIVKKISISFLYLFLGICVLVLSFVNLYKELRVSEYVSVIKKYSAPAVDSDFYLSEYVIPKYENIIFPEKKKNLIIILMESMESSFADKENGGLMNENLIPYLTKIASENVNFSSSQKLGGGDRLSWYWMDNSFNDCKICRLAI